MEFKFKWIVLIYFFLVIQTITGSKFKRRYGYKISDISLKKKSLLFSIHKSKFEDKIERSKSSLSRYFGDRLSAPVQLLESIIMRDIGRFIKISGFLSKIGYKFGRSKHSETALTAACKVSGEVGYFFVSHLISLGASVDTYSEYGYTPLLLACKYQHKDVVKLLIEKGKSRIDCADSDGRTPLFYAISQLDINLVNYLLEKGANPNFRDILGNTPLIHAIMVNFKEAVNSLLINGAFPWIRNYSGFDPVTLSILENRIHILPVLINSKKYSKEELNIRKNVPEYHYAAARRLLFGIKQFIREQILLELLEIEITLENVIVCSTSDQEGLTILWWASKLHYPRFIFRLLEFYLQAQDLPEGHTCNPHKTGNNQILPIELLITHIYNPEPPFGFFRRRLMDLMFKGTTKKLSNTPNIDLMNIFALLYMLDPHSNRSFLIQSLYLNRSIESLTKVLFGIPMIYISSNFQSVTQMLILVKNSDIVNRFTKMIRNIIYKLIKKHSIFTENKNWNSKDDSNEKKDNSNIEQSVLILTSKIICMVYRRNLNFNIEDFNAVYHKKTLNPFVYPLLVMGESNSLEESNLISISILMNNNFLTAFLANLFNQCIEQRTIKSLFKYKKSCIKAYHGALKLALKQYQPTDLGSYFQKGVELSLFILIKNRPESFGEILLELDYCRQSDEAIAVKLLQYIIVGFIPRICYDNKCLFNKKQVINEQYKEMDKNVVFEDELQSNEFENKYMDYLQANEIQNIPIKFEFSPLEFSTRTLLKIPCEVSTSRFVELFLFSTHKNFDLLINGWINSQHISKTLDFILDSKILSAEKSPKFSIFSLQILKFSPKLTSFVLRRSQLDKKRKPFYYYNIKRTMIAESLINHPLFRSNSSIDLKVMSIVVISTAIAILILIAILIVSDSPSSYRKRYLRISCKKEMISDSNHQSDIVTQSDQKVESNLTPVDSNSQSESETCTTNHDQPIEAQEIDSKYSKFSKIGNIVNRIYIRSMIKISSFLTSKKQISPTFILANNLPIKSRTIFRAILFGIKCTFFGYDAYEDICFKIRLLIGLKSSNMYQRKTNSFALLGIIRIIIFLLSIYWIISCKNYDLFIITIYVSIFSVISNASLSLGNISIQERDKLFHLFIPSSVELLDISKSKNPTSKSDINIQDEFNCNQMIDFTNHENSDFNPSSNVSPIISEKVAYILDKYSDSLLTPVSNLLPTQTNQPLFQLSYSTNSNNKDNVQILKPVIDQDFWESKLPSHKYWSYKDVFYEYHSLWLSSQYSEVFQTYNSNNSTFNSNCNSPNSNTMTSQNPFDAINSCMVLSENYYVSSTKKYFNSNNNFPNSNNPQNLLSTNSKSGECTPSIIGLQNNHNLNLQNISIEHHILSICQAEFIKPNDCRIWYIIQWLTCIFIIFSFYFVSLIDKRNLYYHFLQYPEKWKNFSGSTFVTICFEVIINSHLALLIWCFLNPLGFLWVILIQRFRIFLYIINNLLQRRKKRKLTNMSEILILRELTFFITLWNFVISRNNSFLQLTLYNRYFKSAYFCFLFFFTLHFFIIKGQLSLIIRSQLFFTLLSFIISLGVLLIVIFIFVLVTNFITRNISSSINSILHTYYHNKLFHLFLRREIAILSAKRHDAFLHFEY